MLLRTSVRSTSFNLVTATKGRSLIHVPSNSRYMHQAALAAVVPQHYADANEVNQSMYSRRRLRRRREGSLSVRTREGRSAPISELEQKVQALQNTAVNEASIQNLPGFSEDDLLNIYQDLLALPPSDAKPSVPRDKGTQAEEDQTVILAVDHRLIDAAPDIDSSLSPVAASLRDRRPQDLTQVQHTDQTVNTKAMGNDNIIHFNKPHQRIISRLTTIISRLDAVQSTVSSGIGKMPSRDSVPISILTAHEWLCLVRTCLREQDGGAAEQTVALMKRYSLPIPEEPVNLILAFYADQGDVARTESFMAKCLTKIPTHRQRDLHVKSHLRASPVKAIPDRALAVLHQYELKCIPAPMQTYTRLITALFSAQSSIAHAQAWDLFTHMRYVAHPTPDALLYTLMIRACASSLMFSSEPERALDLWTEMTVDREIQPSAGAYTAIILACARSGSKTYIHEAFRLAKEMLDSHRDASGTSAFKPDGKTFVALLEGAKRTGDLARTRWILAEMVRGHNRNKDSGFVDADITEEVMMHVFHAYAAYTAPFKRAAAVLVDEKQTTLPQMNAKTKAQTSSVAAPLHAHQTPGSVPTNVRIPSFSHLPPQSRSEVIGEVRTLFARILDDTDGDQLYANPSIRPFSKVKLTPRLLNSYLSVHYTHAPFEDACELFKRIFEEHGVSRNVRSYVEALERCGNARRGRERTAALAFAEELWVRWQSLENGEHNDNMVPNKARMIERANVAMIRVWTLVGDLDRAVSQVKAFAERYPPLGIRQPAPKLPIRSTCTVLQGTRPLVRMTSTVELPDDTVPPLLIFTDVEILHHRLVAAGRKDAIGYIKYISKAYEGALRTRRDLTMHAEPTSEL